MDGLDHLLFLRHEVVLFQVLDPWERDLPLEGNVRFRDLETGETLTTLSEGVRDGYRAAVRQWLTDLDRECISRGIDRVELTTNGRRTRFVRGAGRGWATEHDGRQLPASVASHIDVSLRFMRVAAPVRVMTREEWQGESLEEFGLDPPRYAVSLHQGERMVLAGRFGSTNPQEIAQYVQIDGRNSLYLMPRFVGREWELLAAELGR
jgi:hypothetical protein